MASATALQCKWDGVAGHLDVQHATHSIRWKNNNQLQVVNCHNIKQLQLSKKGAKTSMRIVAAETMKTTRDNAEEDQQQQPPSIVAFVLDFESTESRQLIADAITQLQQVKKEEEVENDTKERILKRELDGESPLTDGLPLPVKKNVVSYSFHGNITEEQRARELVQLRSLLIDTFDLSESEAEGLVVQCGGKMSAIKTEDGNGHTQSRGVLSVFDALNDLVDPQTTTIAPLSEQKMSDIFKQVPELAYVYQRRVHTKEEETEFWEAVVRKTLFFSNTFLEAEIAAVKALKKQQLAANKARKSGVERAAADPTTALDVREAPSKASGAITGNTMAAGGGGGGRPTNRESVMDKWNKQSTAALAAELGGAIDEHGVVAADVEEEETAARGQQTILAHSALFDSKEDRDLFACHDDGAHEKAGGVKSNKQQKTLRELFTPNPTLNKKAAGTSTSSSRTVVSSAPPPSSWRNATQHWRCNVVATSHQHGNAAVALHSHHDATHIPDIDLVPRGLVKAFWSSSSASTAVGSKKRQDFAAHLSQLRQSEESKQWTLETKRQVDRVLELTTANGGSQLPSSTKKEGLPQKKLKLKR